MHVRYEFKPTAAAGKNHFNEKQARMSTFIVAEFEIGSCAKGSIALSAPSLLPLCNLQSDSMGGEISLKMHHHPDRFFERMNQQS